MLYFEFSGSLRPSFCLNEGNLKMFSNKEINEVARLRAVTQLSNRGIAERVGRSDSAVGRVIKRLEKLQLVWPKTEEVAQGLQSKVYPNIAVRTKKKRRPPLEKMFTAMQFRGQKLFPLVMEYRSEDPATALGKTSVYGMYRDYRNSIKLSQRGEHKAGEIIYVDFSGTTVAFTDGNTKLEKPLQVFVGVFGCSGYGYAHATEDQTSISWVDGQIAMVEHCGGVPEIITPDCAKAVVTKIRPNRVLNTIYESFARHYRLAVVPARPGHPQDKALVENFVGFIKGRILIEMKKMVFHSIDEVNAWLKKEVEKLNEEPFQKKKSFTRKQLFEKFDKPMLSPLPKERLEIIEEIFQFKVRDDYIILIDEHEYMVPWQLAHEKVDVHLTRDNIHIYKEGNFVKPDCTLKRDGEPGGQTIVEEYRHPKHTHYVDRDIEYYWDWAESFGAATQQLMAAQFIYKHSKARLANNHCREIQKLSKKYEPEVFESACQYAIKYQATTVTSFKNILASKIFVTTEEAPTPPPHSHVRGAKHYSMGVTQYAK